MNILLLIRAMVIIFLLIFIGYVLYKKGLMTEQHSRFLSFIITSITNPCLLVNSALTSENPLTLSALGIAILASAFIYAVLIAASLVLPRILYKEWGRAFQFELLMVYGNIAFIGFPVISTVMGKDALAYASINSLFFNAILYSYGIAGMNRAKARAIAENPALAENESGSTKKSLINPGTIAAFITLILYLVHPNAPEFFGSFTGYIGNATVFLSMLVLGGALAAMPLRKLFLGDLKVYVFLFLRLFVLPVLILFVLKIFIKSDFMLGTMAILMALPGANMPLMFCKEFGLESEELARGILLSTLLCIITIPLVCLFL